MRMMHLFLCALFLLRLPTPVAPPQDIVIVVDTSGMTLEEAGDEPWLSVPCLNPAHHYYKPQVQADSGATYPQSPSGEVDTSVEYRFRSCFLLEEEALGWRAWENHFAYDESGALVRITDPEASGCVYAPEMNRALARALIEALLKANPNCRIALCCVGGPFDTRFCVNFTREGEKLLSALYAASPSGIGDRSSALAKAGEYMERRRADERRARPVTVVVLSVEGEDEGLYAARAKEEALRLKMDATLLWFSPLETDAGDILTLLGYQDTLLLEFQAQPSPSARREAESNTRYP